MTDDAQRKAQSKYHKRIYNELKDTGICVRCRKSPAANGTLLCEACGAYRMTYTRERYWRLKTAGICQRCSKEQAQPGKTMCFSCAIKKAEYDKKRYYRKKGMKSDDSE